MMATIDTGASAPAQGPRSTTDALVDSAIEALADLDATPTPKEPASRPVPAKEQAEKRAPQAAEDDEQDEEGLAGDDEPSAAEAQGEADEEGEPEEHSKGSLEDPLTVKDIPDHLHVRVKVDGEEQTLPLKEVLDGYIREQTFSKRITKTKQLADEAAAYAQHFQQERANLRAATRTLLSDPAELFTYFTATEQREQVLLALAQRFAAQVREHREDPEKRLLYQRQRDERRLAEERERWMAAQRAEAQQKHAAEQQRRFESVMRPGWADGLKRAGFPNLHGPDGQPSAEGNALWDEVMVRINQRAAAGKDVTAADVSEFVYRAAKLLELQPRNAGKRPRPVATQPKPAEPARRKGSDPWASKSPAQRRKDPEFWLRNVRSRDYR